MKLTSSSTDSNENAVCNLGEPRYSSVQRARTIADMLGMQPDSAANTNSVQSGAPKWLHSSRASRPLTPMAVTPGRIRLWP